MSVCPSVCLSICLSVHLSICLSVCLSVGFSCGPYVCQGPGDQVAGGRSVEGSFCISSLQSTLLGSSCSWRPFSDCRLFLVSWDVMSNSITVSSISITNTNCVTFSEYCTKPVHWDRALKLHGTLKFGQVLLKLHSTLKLHGFS